MSIELFELTPLQKYEGRYTDKYGHKAMFESIHMRHLCYECGGLVFEYDPEDHNYLKCHKCGARKTVPKNYLKITSSQWIIDNHLKDCFTIFSDNLRSEDN